MQFVDRHHAGRLLAAELLTHTYEQPVVLALPRGGVPVAYEVADALGAVLDVLVVRKLGCPWQPELGLGAITEGGIRLLNHDLIRSSGVSASEVESVARIEAAELARRVASYRGSRSPTPVAGRTAIIVDDGFATGFTARAAAQAVRQLGARSVVLAAPVAPATTVNELANVADNVVCLHAPARFSAIGAFYHDFTQVSDDDVRSLLATSGARRPGHNDG
ncbi:MAG: phosphoribosyltransferase family protein [Nitriliruptoraceae bacterium]